MLHQSTRAGPNEGQGGVSEFPHTMEGRRPRHPHPERSQSGVREAEI